MNDLRKTKAQLAAELAQLRSRVAELETVEAARQQAEAALRESEARFRAIFEHAPVGFFQSTPEGRYLTVNPALARMLGYASSDEMVSSITDIAHQIHVDPARRQEFMRLMAERDEVLEFVNQNYHKDGHRLHTLNNARTVRDQAGQILYYEGFMTDVTARTEAESALRESEERFRLAFDTSPDAININRLADGLYVDINQGFTALTGFTRQDTLGRTSSDINLWYYPADRQRLVQILRTTGYCDNLEAQFRRKDGTLTTALMSARIITLQGVPHVLSITRDISNRKRMERALRENLDYLQAVLDSTNDALFVEDADTGQIIDANRHMCELYGYTREEVLRLPIGNLNQGEPPYSQVEALTWLAKAREIGPQTFEWQAKRKDGDLFWVEASIRFARFGSANRFVVSVRDITERKQAEAALRESQALYQSLVEVSPLCICRKDVAGRFVFANRRFLQESNIALADLLGKTDFDLHPPELAEKYRRDDQVVIDSGQAQEFIEERAVLDGQSTVIQSYKMPIYDAAGNTTGVQISFWDITARQRAEMTLRARVRLSNFADTHTLTELLQKALDEAEALTGSQIGFFHFLDADQQTLHLQMWSTNTVQSMCTAEGQGQHYPVNEAGVWVDCIAARRPVIHNDYASLPHRKGLPDGHAPVVRELVVPVLRNDLIVAIFGVGNKTSPYDDQDVDSVQALADLAWDVVQRKRAEEAVRELSIYNRNLIEVSLDPLVTIDPTGQIADVNLATEQVTGYPREALIGTNFSRYFTEPERAEAGYRQVFLEGTVHDYPLQIRRRDGRLTSVLYNATVYRDEAGQIRGVFAAARDITARKQSEEQLQRYEFIVNAAAESMTLVNPHHVIEAANDAYCHAQNLPRDQIIGCSLAEVWGEDRYREKISPRLAECFAGHVVHYEEAFAFDDNEPRHYQVGMYPYAATVGGPVTYAAIVTVDVTKRVRAEAALRDLNTTLEERVANRTRQLAAVNERLAAANAQLSELDRLKDDFISRISHELRTPLTSVKIYLELLETGKPEKRARYMQVLTEQANRLQQLIESLLEVTQKSINAAGLHVAPIDLNHLAVSLASGATSRAAERGLAVNCTLMDSLPFAAADGILLSQALSHLVTNALNYTPTGGSIELVTAQVIDNGEDWITFTVRDTGPGIAPDELPRIFERFYRGRAAADYKTSGAGVGLSVSRDILNALNGRLTVDSQPGAGATFTAWLKPA